MSVNNPKTNIFNEIDLKNFTASIEDVVKEAIENYWELDNIKVKINALNNFRDFREEKTIFKINFFSGQIKVPNHRPIIFRLSEEFVDSILTKVLKRNTNKFNLNFLTDLEVKILNNFCEFLYKKLNKILFPADKAKITEQSSKSINLVLLVSLFDDECSKVMLSIPKDRFKFKKIEKVLSFKDDNFLTSYSIVKIRAGSSKITLDELKNLSVDDIIFLENSNSKKLTLISGELVKKFSVKVDSSLIFNIESDEIEKKMQEQRVLLNNEVTMEKNIWDDIQIEINAEFEKVKMTIGELKQITQGQIVDLGTVFDNEISLFVEDKIIAKGDLIIINDRYAVKLNKVYSPQTTIQKSSVEKPIPKKQENPLPQSKLEIKTGTMPRPTSKLVPNQSQIQTKPIQKKHASTPETQGVQAEEDFDYSDFEK